MELLLNSAQIYSLPIYMTLGYDYQRSGADMKYRFYYKMWINSTSWYYNNLALNMYLNGSNVFGKNCKSSSKGWCHEGWTDWYTVSNKTSGTTSFYIKVDDTQNSGWCHYTSGTWGLYVAPAYTSITRFDVSKISGGDGLTKVLVTWGASDSCDYLQYSTDNGGSWHDAGGYPTFNIGGLSPNTGYNFKIKVRRADSGLWTESGTYWQSTYDYNKVTSGTPNISSGNALGVSASSPSGATCKIRLETLNPTVSRYSLDGTSGSFSVAQMTALMALYPNSTSFPIRVVADTYVNGVVAYNHWIDGTFTISSSGNQPTFTLWNYEGTNSIANDILGTNQVLIQKCNGILITCSEATAKNGATISRYEAIVNGVIYSTSDLVTRQITIPNLDVSGDVIFQVRAVDTRGFNTLVEKHIAFIAYNEPDISDIILKRENNYDKEVSLSLNGIISLVNYLDMMKNDVLVFAYRFKKANDTEYGTWVDIPTSTDPNTSENYYFNTSTGAVTLSETQIGDFITQNTYTFQFRLKDKLNDYYFLGTLVNGVPLMALRKKKLGINCVPDPYGQDGIYVNDPNNNIIAVESINAPALLNNWRNYGEGYNPAGYYKDRERVYFSGLIIGGVSGWEDNAICFYLPEGYRPAHEELLNPISDGVIGRIDVYSNGMVKVITANNWLSLDNISFRVAE